MAELLESSMVPGILLTLLCILVLGLLGWLKFKKDEKIVTEVLRQSNKEHSYPFVTTNAIASATQLSERRVKKVCRKSTAIKNHHEDQESWKISE